MTRVSRSKMPKTGNIHSIFSTMMRAFGRGGTHFFLEHDRQAWVMIGRQYRAVICLPKSLMPTLHRTRLLVYTLTNDSHLIQVIPPYMLPER